MRVWRRCKWERQQRAPPVPYTEMQATTLWPPAPLSLSLSLPPSPPLSISLSPASKSLATGVRISHQ
eukprot:2254389-Pleurochrysis_carterae.AAC.1